MEKFQELSGTAKKKIQIADHILTQTYPLVKDPKLLLAVMEDVFLALTNSIGSILYYELLFKRVPPFQDNFSSKFNMFKAKCVNRYNIDPNFVNLIQSVKEIIVMHKKSPVEFVRKDSYVICNGDYKIKTITLQDMKDYVNKAKLFIEVATNIIGKNGGIFLRRERHSL